MKKIITLTESDLARIVRRVIKEQNQTSGTTAVATASTIGGVTIPGFLFAEDDTNWLETQNKQTGGRVSQEMISNENARRVGAYYGAQAQTVDANNLFNKYMIAFNAKPANPSTFINSKENVYQKTFLITKVIRTKNNFTVISPAEGSAGFHVRVTPVGSTTRGRGQFTLNNGDSILQYASNGVFNRAAEGLDKIPYEQLDPKFKFSK
jgi:hypothetical protein